MSTGNLQNLAKKKVCKKKPMYKKQKSYLERAESDEVGETERGKLSVAI